MLKSPRFCLLSSPTALDVDGSVVAAATTMSVKNTHSFKDTLKVDMNVENLQYVRAALKHGTKGKKRKAPASESSAKALWRSDRHAYVVKLDDGDASGKKHRTVRPASKATSDVQEALASARRILDGNEPHHDDGSAEAPADECADGDNGNAAAQADNPEEHGSECAESSAGRSGEPVDDAE